MSKAFYSITQNENQQLILNIDNKGSKDNFAVGNIRIENLNGADESIIKQCIEDCLLQKKSVSSIADDKPELPSDFRQEIYSAWSENCENKNITLKIIQSHNNQDIFRATCEKDNLVLGYGMAQVNRAIQKDFSKIEVLEKSSETILEKVKGLVYGF